MKPYQTQDNYPLPLDQGNYLPTCNININAPLMSTAVETSQTILQSKKTCIYHRITYLSKHPNQVDFYTPVEAM